MKDSEIHAGPDDTGSNESVVDSLFEIELTTNFRHPPTTNHLISETSRIAFALGRLGRILIDIARNPKPQQNETDSKD